MLATRLSNLCASRGISLKHACDQAGVVYKTLHAQIAHDRPIPFETIAALADYFHVPMETFSSKRSMLSLHAEEHQDELHRRAADVYTIAMQVAKDRMLAQGYPFGTDDVLNWLNRNNGRLDDFEVLKEQVDLFHPIRPEDRIMRPSRLGVQSLATEFFALKGTQDYIEKVSTFDRQIIDNVMQTHIQASSVPYIVSDQELHVRIGNREVRERYRRIIARVHDRNGSEYTLVHAKII